jgi:hypothetical protein
MRFMMLMIPKVYAGPVDPNFAPPADAIEKMMKYNAQLAKAGVLLALDGLQPSEKGARVRYSGGKVTVSDGPFTETKEVVGGYWLIQVKSRDEALEWARRIPAADGDIVEVRPMFEMTDFPADLQAAADSGVVKDALAKK